MALASEIRRASNADGAVVLHLRRGTMFLLNPMASTILDLLELDTPLSKIAEQISAESDVPLQVVEADIAGFLRQLRLHGVIDSRAEEI